MNPPTRWAENPLKADRLKQTAYGRYELDFYDGFEGGELNLSHWIPYYLPQWSAKELSKPTYSFEKEGLILSIAKDQKPWCPEWNGKIRVSSLQTGVYSGERGSRYGQHRFSQDCLVREVQAPEKKYTPRYGYFELRAKCLLAPHHVAAFWMIGYEDSPEKSAEICIFEAKGHQIKKEAAVLGFGVHPFQDSKIIDEFYEEEFPVDVSEYHTYAAEWTKDFIAFYLDGKLIKTVHQSPDYEMQLMLNLYDLENINAEGTRFSIEYVAGYKGGPPAQFLPVVYEN